MLNLEPKFERLLISHRLEAQSSFSYSSIYKVIIGSAALSIDSKFYNKQLSISFTHIQSHPNINKDPEWFYKEYDKNKQFIPSECHDDQMRLTDQIVLNKDQIDAIGHRLLAVLKYILDDYKSLAIDYPIIHLVSQSSLDNIKFIGLINDVIIEIEINTP